MAKPVYVLGTGLSHDGSVVLLKDGQVCVGIEKERLSRIKHDGGNDSLAINYCLEAEGITLSNVDLVVQCANFEVPDRDQYAGPRVLAGSDHPPLVSISHHLAHAYSAIGTCPFDEGLALVIDGCGSPSNQCMDLTPNSLADQGIANVATMQCEKDSLYRFEGNRVTTLLKDFSEMASVQAEGPRLPTTKHSIGGFYAAMSHYVFGNLDDAGKLMGLAPNGRPNQFDAQPLHLVNGRLLLTEDWPAAFQRPAENYEAFRADFQYYADVAYWAQQAVEKAVVALMTDRLNRYPHTNVCYTGGVALNVAANYLLLEKGVVNNLYLEPAASDNGLALGCAYYGWMETLGRDRVPHHGGTTFGKSYSVNTPPWKDEPGLKAQETSPEDLSARVAKYLADGKTVAWFQGGAEFGPRALGKRSILGHPGKSGLRDHINRNIKFREDFRPFAPAVHADKASWYFRSGRESPYMILLDQTRPAFETALQNVTHVNGTARVQTVTAESDPAFYDLIQAFGEQTGTYALINTSLNKRGQPIVETPQEAFDLFAETALDVLVVNNWVVEKVKKEAEKETITQIIDFLEGVGIAVEEKNLGADTFLPGLNLFDQGIYLDRTHLKYPGDLLHEAGHFAVTEKGGRHHLNNQDHIPDGGEEMSAILWSYAASHHLGLDPSIVFHPNGYKGDSEWILQNFANQRYVGLPMLVWMGLTEDPTSTNNGHGFPKMIKWLRD